MILSGLLLATTISIVTTVTNECAAVHRPLPENGVCQHQGSHRKLHVQGNTLQALAEAVKDGAEMVEFDLVRIGPIRRMPLASRSYISSRMIVRSSPNCLIVELTLS